MAEPPPPETILTGGNMTPVARVGDTVRRASGPWTPTIHALLRHVRAAGFALAPEPLGIDDRGREILSFLPGLVPTYPLPAFVLSGETLTAAGRTLRSYHDATAGFQPPAGGAWRWPAREPAEVICHNDFAPYNLVFDGTRLAGVIDFDLAAPGPRVRDLAYAAYRFVPLTDPGNPDVPYSGVAGQRRRLARFCAAYAEPEITPRDVIDAAVGRLDELVAFIGRAAAAADPAQRAVLDRGDAAIYARDLAYLDARRETLGRA